MTIQAQEVDADGRPRPARWLGPATWGLRAGAVGCTTLGVAGAMAIFGTVRWGMALAVALVAVTAAWLWWRGMGLRRLRRRLRAEGKVLAGAAVSVHAVSPVAFEELEKNEATGVDAAADELFRVDLTVEPRDATEEWTPGGLRWLPPGASVQPRSVGDAHGAVAVETRQGSRFVTDLGDSWRGAVRLRAVVRVPRGSRRVRLAYRTREVAALELVATEAGAATADPAGQPVARRPTGCCAIHSETGEYVGLGPDAPERFRDYDYGSTIAVVWDEVAALGRTLGLGDLDAFVCPEPVYRQAEGLGEELEEAEASGDAEQVEELRRARAELLPSHDPSELNRLVRALAAHLREGGDGELSELALLDLEAYGHALDRAAALDLRVFVSPY